MAFTAKISELIAQDRTGLLAKHDSWERIRLADVATILNGAPFDSAYFNTSNGTPLARIRDVLAGETSTFYTGEYDDTYLLSQGDLLIGMDGDFNTGYWGSQRALLNQRVCKVCPVEDFYDKTLLGYVLPGYLAAINAHTPSITVKHLSSRTVGDIELPLPPRVEQARIAEKLDELFSDLDAGVAELKAAQRKLAQYRQSLLKAAVEGALTADWRAARGEPDETGAELLQRILTERRARWEQKQLAKFAKQGKLPPKGWQAKYPEPMAVNLTDLPALPADWIWASLDMLGEIASGVAKGSKRSGDIPVREVPYLRVANVQRGYLDLTQIKTIQATETDIAELRLHPGDVLFNEGGDLDKLGRGWVWYGEIPECIHQNHVFRMRPALSATPSEFISHHGNSFGKEWFKNAGKQTTNLASINMTMLRAFPVPVPPESESKEILARLGPLLRATAEQGASLERGLTMAFAQRRNILRNAFAGQLVQQNPDDEPASALLARIRSERMASDKQPKARKTKPQKEIAFMARKLIDVLTAAGDWIAAQDAFRQCGVVDGSSTDQIEALYAELSALDKEGRLDVEVITDSQGRKVQDRLKLRTT